MTFLRVIVAVLVFCSSNAFAGDEWYAFFDKAFTVNHAGTNLRVGILKTPNASGTVVYMPGFADTIDNHEALLKGFQAQGLQVIAFDYPEHGWSDGLIRWWALKDLAEIIPTVLADSQSEFNPALPVILAGWSTGGTIAIRIAQAWQGTALPAGVRLGGVVAFAPALPAKVVINVKPEYVTDGDMKRDPSPKKVPIMGQFATSITLQSRLAYAESVPANIPTLILFAGDRDNYAKSKGSKKWVKRQGAHVVGFECEGGMHGFEFEQAFSEEARQLATGFAGAAARDGASVFKAQGKACPRVMK